MEKTKKSKQILDNKLRDGDQDQKTEKPVIASSSSKNKSDKTTMGFLKRADWGMTLMLRTIFAGIPASVITGILAGGFEAATGLDIEFGTAMFFFVSVPHFIILFYAFMKAFAYFGTFEKKD